MAPFLKNPAGLLQQSIGKVLRVPSIRLSFYKPMPNGRFDEDLKDMFEAWMIEHNKSYHSLEEKEKRFQIYKKTVRQIEVHNTTYDPINTHKINRFADLTRSEFTSRFCRRSWDNKGHLVFNRFNPENVKEA